MAQKIMNLIFLLCLVSGCAYDHFPATWKNIYVKDHDFHNVTVCDVIDAFREDSLPALEYAGLHGYSVILNMDVSQEIRISDEGISSHDHSLLPESRFSLSISSLPLGEAFKFLGQARGLEVEYKKGIVFLKERHKNPR